MRVKPTLAATLLAVALTATAQAQVQVGPAISSQAKDVDLKAFLAELRRVADTRDMRLLRPLLHQTFFWDQDFGGMQSATDSPLTNFIAALSLDDEKLRPEAQGSGWKRFADLAGATTSIRHPERRGVVCQPGGRASVERLCFGRDKGGAWKIVGYMGGGD